METPEETLERMLKDGSMALHVDHEWLRSSEWQGIWCVECDLWVVKPGNEDGRQAQP